MISPVPAWSAENSVSATGRPAVAVISGRALDLSASVSLARLSAKSAPVSQRNPSADNIARSGPTSTRRGRSSASIQSVATPASEASSRTAASFTGGLQKRDGASSAKLAALRQRVLRFEQQFAAGALNPATPRPEVGGDREARAVAHAPARTHGQLADGSCADGARAAQSGHDQLAADRQQPPIE